MTTKKTKVEPKLLTRDNFDHLHIAYSGTTVEQIRKDIASLFNNCLYPEDSLLDDAILSYFVQFAYICKINTIPYYKFYYAHKLSRVLLHIISTGKYDINELRAALLSKLNNLRSSIVGLVYDLSEINNIEYENASEPIKFDDDHDPIVYRDHLLAIECYNTFTGINQQPPESAAGQVKSGTKAKAPPVEAKRYAFTLSSHEADLLARLYSPLLQCNTLWRQCFIYKKAVLRGIERVTVPNNPHILSLPPLAAAYPFRKLSALDAKIVSIARPKAAELYRSMKKLIESKASESTGGPQ